MLPLTWKDSFPRSAKGFGGSGKRGSTCPQSTRLLPPKCPRIPRVPEGGLKQEEPQTLWFTALSFSEDDGTRIRNHRIDRTPSADHIQKSAEELRLADGLGSGPACGRQVHPAALACIGADAGGSDGDAGRGAANASTASIVTAHANRSR